MKNFKILFAALLSISLLASCNNEITSEIDGKDGSTWLCGNEVPSKHLPAKIGDFYFDKDDGDVYRLEESGWVLLLNITGPQGEVGETGNPGKSAYDLYVEKHPEYTKTQQEWIEELVNGELVEVEKHTVTFNPNNGGQTFTKEVEDGGKLTKPTDPSNGEYTFLGWYDSVYDEKWMFSGFIVTEDITLTAKWSNTTEDSGNQGGNSGNQGGDSGNQGGDSGNTGGNTPSYTYTDFSANEKTLFNNYFGFVIPFIPNNEYYVEEYEFVGEEGLNFYTIGNSQSDFDTFRNVLTSSGYVADGTEQDEYGDTWYFYLKGEVYIDASFYTITDGDYPGDYIDIYVYVLTEDSDNTGGGSGDSGEEEPSNPGTQVPVKKYEKITSSLTDWSGNYLIVYEEGNLAFDGSLATLDAVSNTFNVTISNNSIDWSEAVQAKSFTIEKLSSGYSIKSASGYYIGNTSDSNKILSSTSTQYTNTISLDNESIKIVGQGNSVLRFNSATDQNRFRYYKSGTYSSQQAIQLYKLTESTTGEGGNAEGNLTPTGDVTTVDFNSSKVTFKNKNDINYYEYGCPTMNDGTNSPKVLVIPVEFSDVTAQSKGYTIEGVKNAFLPKSETNATLDYYSVYDYFYASSYGKLSLDITVCDSWFKPQYASTYYASYTEMDGQDEYFMGDQLVIDEALAYLSQTMDLSKFDSDNDQVIDAVVIINTLDIDPNTDINWAYQYYNYLTDDEGYYYEYDGVSANTYLWAQYGFLHDDGNSEDYSGLANPTNTYTFIHEFSHVLGADDYYDYSDLGNHPLNGYDIMDSSTADHNPFTKMHYGWISASKVITATSSVTVDLNAFEETGDTIIIANNYDETKGVYQEYWLICYYNNTGLNESPYGLFEETGIVVYHVNATLTSEVYEGETYYYFANSNSDASHEYGTVNNLIEFVKNGNDYVYTVGDSLSSTIKDDNNVKVPYTFTVDSIDSTKATLTFTVNN